MYLTKTNGFTYQCLHDDKVLFSGRHKEMLAFGHWNFGIPKDQMYKALELLDKTAIKIYFKDNEIVIDNGPEIA